MLAYKYTPPDDDYFSVWRSGSIVVTYEVVVAKKGAAAVQLNIISAIKEHSSSFAGSAIDGNSVSTSG